MPRIKKRLSKRKTLKLKHKIEKNVAAANKKARKEARNNQGKPRKDPGIPNMWPYKEEELKKLEEKHERIAEEKERQRELRKKQIEKKRREKVKEEARLKKLLTSGKEMAGGALTPDMLMQAGARQAAFDASQQEMGAGDGIEEGKNERWSQKSHIRELKKVLEMADIMLEIVDARDPVGCRCSTLETLIDADVNKKLIIILNKIDLVPREAVDKWLTYLRKTHPTIAFKASTQQKGKVRGSKVDPSLASGNLLQSSECLGADTLVQLLKNYSRSHDMKRSITVGVFGYPNVGKSSLINSLKRAKAVGVSSVPGFTRSVTEIYLDKNIKLLDCPGVVFDSAGTSETNDCDVILRNAVAVDKVPDPIKVVQAIVKRCSEEGLQRHYMIPNFSTITDFLVAIADKRGKLRKGGARDLEAAARTVLVDWNVGKIPFYTTPPVEESTETAEAPEVSAVVTEFAPEFDLSDLFAEEAKALDSLPQYASHHVTMKAGQLGRWEAEDEDMDDDDDDEDDDGDEDDDDDDDDME